MDPGGSPDTQAGVASTSLTPGEGARHRRLHVHHLDVLFLCWRAAHGKLIVPVTPVITPWFPVNRFVL